MNTINTGKASLESIIKAKLPSIEEAKAKVLFFARQAKDAAEKKVKEMKDAAAAAKARLVSKSYLATAMPLKICDLFLCDIFSDLVFSVFVRSRLHFSFS